jgi:hypothetical protein
MGAKLIILNEKFAFFMILVYFCNQKLSEHENERKES